MKNASNLKCKSHYGEDEAGAVWGRSVGDGSSTQCTNSFPAQLSPVLDYIWPTFETGER